MVLSCPSYIIPGTYLENLEHVAKITVVESMELLFFIFDDDTDRLLEKEIDGIREFSLSRGITVHMPDDLIPEHEKIIEMTIPFARHYVMHPPPGDSERFIGIVSGWRKKYGDRFLLENLIDREYESLLARLDGIPVCCDTGHLLVRGKSPAGFLDRYGERIREVHLHGIVDGWDHNPFGPDEEWFLETVPFLSGFDGIVNVEVFKETHLQTVLDALMVRKLIL